MHVWTLRVAAGALCALAAAACPAGLSTQRCQVDADCPVGYRCDPAGQCRQGSARADSGAADTGARDAASGEAGRDAALPDAAAPDTAAVDAERADAVVIDAARADAAALERTAPDVQGVEATLLDAAPTDAATADRAAPDAFVADTSTGDAAPADSAAPDLPAVDAATPQDGFPDPWWNTSWSRRVRLRFHNAMQAEALVGFPVPVFLHPARFDYAQAKADGSDLRFVDGEGELVPHEIEHWHSGDVSLLWLMPPPIEAGACATPVFLYYGNPAAMPPSATGSIWPAELQLVLPMSPELGGPTADRSQGQHAVEHSGSGETPFGPWLGYALRVDGSEQLTVPTLHDSAFPQQQGSLSFLIAADSWSSAEGDLLDAEDRARDHFRLEVASDGIWARAEGPSASAGSEQSHSAPGSGQWTRLSLVWDLSLPNNQVRFSKGDWHRSFTVPASWAPSAQRLLLMGDIGSSFSGLLDDVQLASVARSTDWQFAVGLVDHDVFVVFEEQPFTPSSELSTAGAVWQGDPVALYEFDDGSGGLVRDTSTGDPPLDLTIADQSAVQWLEGALWVQRATTIASAGDAARIYDLCTSADEITIEAWVQPEHALQQGPARIVSMARDVYYCNFTLGQDLLATHRDGARYLLRLNTDDVNNSDTGNYYNSPVLASTAADHRPRPLRTHLVFTWNGDQACAYVDGELSDCQSWPGQLLGDGGWESSRLRLVNDPDPSRGRDARPWLGVLYRVAIYCEALTADQVAQNYLTGMGQ